ncbi:MAG TPA: alcohol dehydrogenase catalytic domain-containing protein [Phycisphaerae bacterium]|nr:alcohol dehydrogenase catalytic domain-containing protein [Phycisphaerae bacterium]
MQALTYQVNPVGWATCKWLRHFWPGCLRSRLNGLALRDLDPPALPGDDWVRVRTRLGGLCGSDLAIVAQKQPPDSILQAFSSMPFVLGHENVSVVEEVGPAVDAAWRGKRVCVEPTLNCAVRGIDPPCERCAAGEFGSCEKFGADGAQGRSHLPAGSCTGYNAVTGGSWGERFVAHVSQLVEVPASLSDELAALTDPVACSLHAALRADLSSARQVLVYGAGVLGLGLIAALRAIGYAGRIDALDTAGYLAEVARKFGADEFLRLPAARGARFDAVAARTGGRVHRVRFGNRMLTGGYDVVFDCVGARRSINESLKWARARGQVVMVATSHGGRIDLTPLWFRELTWTGVSGRQVENFAGRRVQTYQLVHEMMTQGKLDVREMLTHTFRLGQYRQALETAMNKSAFRAIKVAFDFRSQ